MSQIYWPVDPSQITEGYGWADWRQGIHDGIDFRLAQGSELRATASGIVRNNDAGTAGGAGVDITTPDGWVARHWHVSKFLVANGSRVEAGDVIALSGGAPGTWGAGFSTGPHLHWGIRVQGRWVDPKTLNPQTFGNSNIEQKDDEMKLVRSSSGQVALIGEYVANPLTGTTLSPGDVAWLSAANEAVYGGSTVDDAQFNALMRDARGRYNGLLNDIVSRMGNISLNVDAIAQAIAEKINGSVSPHVTTKSDILTSIEKNYPES